jgi:hypothetical protein
MIPREEEPCEVVAIPYPFPPPPIDFIVAMLVSNKRYDEAPAPADGCIVGIAD